MEILTHLLIYLIRHIPRTILRIMCHIPIVCAQIKSSVSDGGNKFRLVETSLGSVVFFTLELPFVVTSFPGPFTSTT